jgi:DHA1 family bicyclomycin/chloramphenicol resistance-like MFS transporter
LSQNPEIAADAGLPTGRSVRSYLIVFFGALVALGPLSMDAYLPAIPAIAADFGVSIVKVNNTLSIFLIGYALGQFFGGSFSDQIGRKRIGYVGLTVYVAATFATAFVDTVDHMLVLRFLQAIGGGFSTVICMASVRDIYPIEELGRRFATITMIVLVAPLVAPTLGSLLLPLGWHSIFLLKAVYAAILFVLYVLIVPETRAGGWGRLTVLSLFRQCGQVLVRRVDGRMLPLRYACAMALSASVLMIFVTNAAFVYMDYFQVSPAGFPLVFAMSVLGFMSMNLFSMKRLTSANADLLFRNGLRIQIVAVALLLVIVVSGVATLWNVVPLILLMMSTLGLVAPAGSARYMSFFSELAGSASSVYTTLMFLLGGILGALVGAFYDGTLLPMIGVMAAASTAANLIAVTMPSRETAA